MTQHFLLSTAARSLSLAKVARMSDEEARAAFQAIRWADNDGKPYCPKCGSLDVWACRNRALWQCKGCNHQFSVTSGTIFANRKMTLQTYLLAIAIFVNGAKGHSALQLSRDLDCQYKTAFVLAHKLREALAATDAEATVSGEVEIDGMYTGGYVKPANHKENRKYPQFLHQRDHATFDLILDPGTITPDSGIYRCITCGWEAVSTAGHPLPPQNHHQHRSDHQGGVRWVLNVAAAHHHRA